MKGNSIKSKFIWLFIIGVIVTLSACSTNQFSNMGDKKGSVDEDELGIGSTRVNKKDGAEMVYVPAGSFLMGSEDSAAYTDEMPEHLVTLEGYWIYKYEVTNVQYQACIKAGRCKGGEYEYDFNDDSPGSLAANWNQAVVYCKWAGGQLPTEAEWEKAARGTDGRTYPWGETIPNHDLAQFGGGTIMVPVGSFPEGASPYGALDMAGNVWEWVADWYDENYYETSPSENPEGPDSGEFRVLRGGSWTNYGSDLRVTFRYGYLPDEKDTSFGFRCRITD